MIGKNISHYKILEKLGEGGMGVVYKAHDTKLDRIVALKFLPTHLTTNETDKARFLQEAKAAAALNHNNVCVIHDIQEHEGQQFIVMEYVEGKTLRDVVGAHGHASLPIKDVINTAIQTAEALKVAHNKGIVHRDVKTENIMLTPTNQVKVMDFGLAKLRGSAKLTKTSSTIGTVAYMSPEHLQGKEVDARTDIFSFGVVLYEMLTGQLPFRGEYDSAMMYSILNEEPEPVVTLRRDITSNLVQIVNKSLEKDPAMRYQSMQEVLEDLKRPQLSKAEEEEKSIIVLPFDDMSPNKDNEYFSDGLTEEIITDLSHIHDMRVISRTSAMMLKGIKKDMKTIGRELDVQYVLEGSVRKAGNNLRITAQLIDAASDAHLWAEKYSGTMDDVFEIQENVSRSIVDALKMKLSPDEKKKIAERPIENVQAYEYYLKAVEEITKFSEDAINHAIRYLQNAVDIVGDNALLYSGIAFSYWNLVNIGVEHEDSLDRAEEYANRALLVDPDSPLAHVILGYVDMLHGKTLESLPRFKLAMKINRDELFAIVGVLTVYYYAGKISEAVPYLERLMLIDPISFPANWCSGAQYYYDGKFEQALHAWQRLYELHPENPFSHLMYAMILAYNNEIDEAISIVDQSVRKNPDTVFTKLQLILKYALQGDKEKVLQEITIDFQDTVRRDCTFAHIISGFLALNNQKKEAIGWLEIAANNGLINFPLLAKKDIFLENIRGEERFKKLMERVKREWENFEV